MHVGREAKECEEQGVGRDGVQGGRGRGGGMECKEGGVEWRGRSARRKGSTYVCGGRGKECVFGGECECGGRGGSACGVRREGKGRGRCECGGRGGGGV